MSQYNLGTSDQVVISTPVPNPCPEPKGGSLGGNWGEIHVSTTGRDLYKIPHYIRDACSGFLAALEMTGWT